MYRQRTVHVSPEARLAELLSARLILVTGKGGTGKTTLTAALARLAAADGKRVLAAEVGKSGAQSHLLDAFGAEQHTASDEPVQVAPNIWSATLSPEAGHRLFLRDVLPLAFLAERALRAEPVKRFLNAAPAFTELGILYRGMGFLKEERSRGKPKYDLVLIDSPASGHALAFATLPQILLKVIPGGPIGRAVREGIEVLQDPAKTVAVVTTLPETLPVSEALELAAGLARSNMRVHGIIANQVPADPFTAAEHDALLDYLGESSVPGGRSLDRLRRAQKALGRLRETVESVLVVREHDHRGPSLVAAVAQELSGRR